MGKVCNMCSSSVKCEMTKSPLTHIGIIGVTLLDIIVDLMKLWKPLAEKLGLLHPADCLGKPKSNFNLSLWLENELKALSLRETEDGCSKSSSAKKFILYRLGELIQKKREIECSIRSFDVTPSN